MYFALKLIPFLEKFFMSVHFWPISWNVVDANSKKGGLPHGESLLVAELHLK
jgi:hypothetical protein